MVCDSFDIMMLSKWNIDDFVVSGENPRGRRRGRGGSGGSKWDAITKVVERTDNNWNIRVYVLQSNLLVVI